MREVIEAIRRHATTSAMKPAVQDRDGSITYAELWDAIARLVPWTSTLPQAVALVMPKDRAGVTTFLALAAAGRTVTVLPDFFSEVQRAHVLRDFGARAVVAPRHASPGNMCGVPLVAAVPADWCATTLPCDGRLVSYTSGTTGTPKGVVHGDAQIGASVRALIQAVDAKADDRMLSILPTSLLLDQVAGICVPLVVGATIMLCDDPRMLPAAAVRLRPTVTILVPDLLAGWTSWLEQSGSRAPDSLRFVAVGGAPIAPQLAARAIGKGIPVHEGYGLTECCSVVAVNRPGRRAPGTVGQCLAGLAVTIEQGEIVVRGPTVMERYLGGRAARGVWHTGDAGAFDDDGNLIVRGRLDDVIVTTTGRNIHPAWIEAMILADPRIARCAVVDDGTYPGAMLCAREGDLDDADPATLDTLVSTLCAEAPDYARPRRTLLMSAARLQALRLIGPDGRLRRHAIRSLFEESR